MIDINSREFKRYYRELPAINDIASSCNMTLADLADRCHVSLRCLMNWKSGGDAGLTFQARVVLREIYDLYRIK